MTASARCAGVGSVPSNRFRGEDVGSHDQEQLGPLTMQAAQFAQRVDAVTWARPVDLYPADAQARLIHGGQSRHGVPMLTGGAGACLEARIADRDQQNMVER